MRRPEALKAEYPPFRPNELASICYACFGRRPGARTIKRILAEAPAPTVVGRRFPPYVEIEDSVDRRAAIVRLHAEGWNFANIAGYLKTSRPTVYVTFRRWVERASTGLRTNPRSPSTTWR